MCIRGVSLRKYVADLAKAIFTFAPEKRTPWFLRPKRYSRRVRIALFRGKTPDWASDPYKLIKYVNLLELIPTFGAFITAPVHFFRRLPLIRRGKKPWYKTPIAFLSLMVLAAYSCIEFVHPHAVVDLTAFSLRWMLHHDHYGVLDFWVPIEFVILHERIATYLILLVVCFLSPLWILPPCLLLACITWLVDEFRARRKDSVFIKASDLNPHVILIPLDLRIYWRMRPVAFAWGLFYFGLYALFALVFFIDFIAQGPPHFFTRVGGFALFLWFSYYTTMAAAIQFLLIRPYAALLRVTSSPPTRRMRRADAHALISVLRQIQSHVTGQSKSRRDKPEVWKILAIEELLKEWASYSRSIREEVSVHLRNNPALWSSLPQDQRQIFCRALPIEKLREALSFLERFEKIPGTLKPLMQGLESLYEGNGIPPSPTDGREARDLSPSPAA